MTPRAAVAQNEPGLAAVPTYYHVVRALEKIYYVNENTNYDFYEIE